MIHKNQRNLNLLLKLMSINIEDVSPNKKDILV